MSSFTSELWVSVKDDGRTWTVKRPFSYHVGSQYSRTYITVPRNFETDFASIPRWLSWLLPEWAKFHKAAPIHDLLYRTQQIMGKPITRKRADNIFLEAMLVAWRNYPMRTLMAYLEYLAVRIFAGNAWRRARIGKTGGLESKEVSNHYPP